MEFKTRSKEKRNGRTNMAREENSTVRNMPCFS